MKSLIRILSLVKSYRTRIIGYTVLIVLSSVFSVVSITMAIPFLNIIFDRGEQNQAIGEYSGDAENLFQKFTLLVQELKAEQGPQTALLYVSLCLVFLFFLKNLTRYLAVKVLTPVRTGVIFNLRKSIYQKINSLSMGFFTEQKKGDVLTRMSSDVSEVEWTIMNSLTTIIKEPLMILVTLVFMILISVKLTLIIFLILPLSGYAIGKIGKSLKKTSHSGQATVSRLMSLAEETLTGARIVRAFNAEGFLHAKFDTLNEEFRAQNKKMVNRRELSSPTGEFLGSIVIAIVMYIGGTLVLGSGPGSSLNAETFITYILTFSQLISPAKAITTTFYNVQKGMASLERIEELLHKEVDVKEPAVPVVKTDFQYEIKYTDVSFRYEKETVLKSVNLTLPKGKLVALVGQSGSGKSTLADLLPRFYDVENGSITLDGTDIRQMSVKSLRNLLGIVPQQSILFNETVLGNITFGAENPDREKAIEAAKNANAHAFIMELENGYDTNLGEGGNKLSGGQKQRIAIARALYKNPPILILDEATSALDSESEKIVQEALNNLMANRTSLVIAHRLSTVRHADEILVLQRGEIVERGTHSTLIAAGGMYAKLCEMQSFS
ncbi:MAG: ABC transporter ATP-binding protein/permease [Flavobacteriales bacterium]|nr:ABC transporter ATP-binding protein/permease [Flavobacteriales bacterium]